MELKVIYVSAWKPLGVRNFNKTRSDTHLELRVLRIT